MSHKADERFFERKRDWSKTKDRILSNYLVPYLSKVKTLRRPMLLVDGFAGPGVYDDGDTGSPLIFCEKAQELIRDYQAEVRVLCIEKSAVLFERLKENIGKYPFAQARHCSFGDCIDEISQYAANDYVIFLYADPFRPSQLDISALNKIFCHVKNTNASVELLLNFMSSAYHRWGWQILKGNSAGSYVSDFADEDDDLIEDEELSEDRLDRIIGGDWWKEILRKFPPSEQVPRLMDRLKVHFESFFPEVCFAPVKAGPGNATVKYYLVFCSRHSHALILMNDNMIKACGESHLDTFVFGEYDLEQRITTVCKEWITRDAVVESVIRECFCQYKTSDINRVVNKMLNEERIFSETGKKRINGRDRIRNTG